MNQRIVTAAPAQLARRARSFEASPWSDAADIVGRHPDPIYFGNGAPCPDVQPSDRLAWAAERAWSDVRGQLDYGELAGYAPLRELIAERMRLRGIEASADDVLVTSGSQQGIDLAARLILDPGDTIVVEGPTYIGAMQTFDAYEARYLSCPVDEHGLDLDALEAILVEADPAPKLIYTVPTFQNPTGYSLSAERRGRLIELAERFGVLILEDDPYGEIFFDNSPDSALRAKSDRVIYLGSFSKTIAPGLRLGWMVAPSDLMNLLYMAKEGIDIHADRVTTRTVFYTADDFLDAHVAMLRAFYRNQRDALLEALNASAPASVTVSQPQGGFFVWCELPDGYSANEMLHHAAETGVGYLPGSWFYPHGAGPQSGLRLSFSSLPGDRLREGGKRLGEAMQSFLERETAP
jgi:2-aminoadipate transaminase